MRACVCVCVCACVCVCVLTLVCHILQRRGAGQASTTRCPCHQCAHIASLNHLQQLWTGRLTIGYHNSTAPLTCILNSLKLQVGEGRGGEGRGREGRGGEEERGGEGRGEKGRRGERRGGGGRGE